MRNPKYPSEAAIRTRERRQREDEAPRLSQEVPGLRELRLEIEEKMSDSGIRVGRHARVVVVQSAAAMFDLPCNDTSCKDGGHDVTLEVLAALRTGQVEFSGESTCHGQLGSGHCRRVLRYTARAVYAENRSA